MMLFPREKYLRRIRGFYDAADIIKVITGVRRCGKSSLMMMIADEIREKGVDEWRADPSMSDDGKTLSAEKLPDGPTKSYVERVIRDFEIYKEIYFNDVNPG